MLAVIILAAGQGKRMNSAIPKVMHKVAGLPMLDCVIEATKKLIPHQTIIVTSKNLKEYLEDQKIFYQQDIEFAIQEESLGTGHAVQAAFPYLREDIKNIIILYGDTPLIQSETLENLKNCHNELTVLGFKLDDDEIKKGYGRLVIEENIVQEIVEMKDATEEQKQIPFANSGIYKISKKVLESTLFDIKDDNLAKEYYLTDIVKIARLKGYTPHMEIADHSDFLGVNTKVDLAKVENVMQSRLRMKHLENGVTLIDPQTVYFHITTKIGRDVVIYPHTFFSKNVTIEDNVIVYSNCYIEDTHLKFFSKVGPFAHLRNGCILEKKSEVGNFVELKNTHLGEGSKAKHLTYLGDAEIGTKVNIGAGTITCNYNGFKKYKTIIEDNVFVGSNTSLIAPLTLSKGSIIGAGSTITKNVSENDIALTRTEQTIKKGGASIFRKRFDIKK
jgi:bifunctional UDP-N-acetylglucosamine pyrophosphorylase/glucosamine-1-phosphate N-acetyltransferase